MTQQMPNPIPLYEEAAKGFRAAMAAVKEAQMGSTTPCAEWNVRALLNHNLKVAEFVHQLFTRGQSDVDDTAVGGPLPKEGPLAAFDTNVSRVLSAAKAKGALDKQINTPFGPMTGAQFLMAPFMDLLIHRWDLTKATGQNTTLPSNLVGVAASLVPIFEGGRKMGAFGKAVQVPEKASPQDRLIALSGRRP